MRTLTFLRIVNCRIQRLVYNGIMIYETFIPRAPLGRFVDFLWYFSGTNPPGAKERHLPEGVVQLVVNLRDDRLRMWDPRGDRRLGHAVVIGPRADWCAMDNAGERTMIGAQFKPGAAAAFLGVPAYEASGLFLDLADLCGATAADLRDELLHTPSLADRFRILEKWLTLRIASDRTPDAAVAYALSAFGRAPGGLPIGGLSERLNMSPKRFIEQFKREVGMTPKRYSRLIRFRRALLLIRQSEDGLRSWADIAHDCGYYDQAHFIKEFQEFSGLTPTEYRLARSMHPSHLPMF